jgi:putative sigma-54 modulation protein
MELLSHSFFLFYNVPTEEYNIVYRRHDGDYGVIKPELTGE